MEAIRCNRNHPEFSCVTIPLPIPDEEYEKCIKLLEAMEIGCVTGHDCYVEVIQDAPPALDILEGSYGQPGRAGFPGPQHGSLH